MVKALKPFPYYRDGINVTHVKAGDEVNILPDHQAGLEEIGYIEKGKETRMMDPLHPERDGNAPFDDSANRHSGHDPAAPLAPANARNAANTDAATTLDVGDPDFQRGLEFGRTGAPAPEADASNSKYMGGYNQGLAEYQKEHPAQTGGGAPMEDDPDYKRGFALGSKGESSIGADDRENKNLMDGYAAGLAEHRGKLRIVKNWEEMEWGEMRTLANQLSDEPVRSKEEAKKVIQTEVDRRASSKSE